jgi:hypothetical protein
MDTEQQRLASEVTRLELEIEKTRNHGGNGSINNMMATCRGRELLRELEVVLHRQAELEETDRAKRLVQKAIAPPYRSYYGLVPRYRRLQCNSRGDLVGRFRCGQGLSIVGRSELSVAILLQQT